MAKQSGGNTAQRVEALVRPTVEGMGLRLWDVVFEKEGPDWYLRVLIDKTDGNVRYCFNNERSVKILEKLNELYRQRQAVEAELEKEMTRWEELSLQAEEQEN